MTTTEKTKDRFPGPVYAAAGVGELAYQQLRKLPAIVAELRTELPAKAAELRTELPAKAAELRTEIPAVLTSFAADAYTTYLRLVKRGRKVVDGRGAPADLKPAPLPEGVEAKPVVEPLEPIESAPVQPALAAEATTEPAKPKKAVAAKRVKPADGS